MVSQRQAKAFKKRSIVGTVAKVLLALVLLVVVAGVGLRFASPATWEKGVEGLKSALDGPMLDLFKKISVQYVNEADDLDGDEKRAWKERLEKTADALKDGKGTVERRKELRREYEGIVEKMEDGDLTKGELAPFARRLDRLLEQIETEEAQKRE